MRGAVIGIVVVALVGVVAWLAWQQPEPVSPYDSSVGQRAATVADLDSGGLVGSEGDAAAVGLAEASATRAEVVPVEHDGPVYELLVVDPDGQPIADAEVSWLARPTHRVRCDDQGRCRLPVTAGEQQYVVRVERGEHFCQHEFPPPRHGVRKITLLFAGPLRGRVVDQVSGAPLAAVAVTMQRVDCDGCDPLRTTSDDDGWFSLPAVPRGHDLSFSFRGERHALQWHQLRVSGKGEPRECTFGLRPGLRVTGRVVDLQTHQPIAGVALLSMGEQVTTSAADGTFVARLLPDLEGNVYADLQRDGYCNHTWRWRSAEVGDCVMLRAQQLRGVVRDTAGEPLAGAWIDPSRQNRGGRDAVPANCDVGANDWGLRTKTDEQGRFVFEGVVVGDTFRMRAHHEDCEAGEQVEATVAHDAPVVELRLRRKQHRGTAVLTGMLRLNGEPCEGSLRWKVGDGEGWGWADAQNGFRIAGLPAGRATLTLRPGVFRSSDEQQLAQLIADRTIELAEGQQLDMDLDVQFETGTVTGRVLRVDGTPARGIYVHTTALGMSVYERTDDDGNYTLRVPLATDRCEVRCSGRTTPKQHEVAPGAVGVDFEMPLAGELRYRLVGRDGPVSGAQIQLREVDGEARETIGGWQAPDETGYHTATLPQGHYEALIVAQGHAALRRQLTIEEHSVLDVELADGHTVTLRLASDVDEPPGRVHVVLVEQGAPEFGRAMRYGSDNRSFRLGREAVELRHVSDGRHTLRLRGKGLVVEPDTIEVAGADVVCELRWKKVEEPAKPEGR